MGAEMFEEVAYAKSPQEAFKDAVEQARYDYGHAGYTGTIAEKDSFRMVPCDYGREAAIAKMEECFDNEDHFCQDKWGFAACIEVREPTKNKLGEYLFFGWASC